MVDALPPRGVELYGRKMEVMRATAKKMSAHAIPAEEVARITDYFAPPAYESLPQVTPAFEAKRLEDPAFARWVRTNVAAHKEPGYAIANISLKPEGGIPGDATSEQMDGVADLAERYSLSEIRVTHEQNLVLPYLRQSDLYAPSASHARPASAPGSRSPVGPLPAAPRRRDAAKGHPPPGRP